MVALVIGMILVAWYMDFWWGGFLSCRVTCGYGMFCGGLLVRLGLCWLWFITCCFNSVDLRVLCGLLCIAACLRACRLLVIAAFGIFGVWCVLVYVDLCCWICVGDWLVVGIVAVDFLQHD